MGHRRRLRLTAQVEPKSSLHPQIQPQLYFYPDPKRELRLLSRRGRGDNSLRPTWFLQAALGSVDAGIHSNKLNPSFLKKKVVVQGWQCSAPAARVGKRLWLFYPQFLLPIRNELLGGGKR